MSSAPIGVFDSGVGGLTVARAIIDQLPHEQLLYLGDTANGPYGPRPIAEVREHALAVLDELVDQGVKALVIACNTASAAMFRDARERFEQGHGIPVIEVIQPAVRQAVRRTRSKRIGVIGTEGTLKPSRSLNRTLTHEVGHHLSLFHTFYDTNACGSEVDCVNEGDFVCDTPTTTENASCSVGACPDAQLENYMDYAPTSCRNTFTAGQRQRMRTCLETVRSSLLESLGAVPVVDVDLLPGALNASSVCAPTWHPVLSVQNQGVLPAPGATVQWSVNGVTLSPVTFNTPIPAGATVDLALPEKLLIGTLTEWTFTVTLPDGANDDFSGNDTLLHTLAYTGDDAWTLTLNTDFFGNESSWTVADSTGVTLWTGDDYGFGANTYVSSACIPPGCHTLTVEDSGGDGLALGGSLLLQNATGDTLAHIPQGTNFGESITLDACAATPAIYNPWEGNNDDEDGNSEGPEPCETPCPGDLNGDGFIQAADLLDFLVVFGLPCNP